MPYWLMTSTGSTTLPMDLLIFRPCPSLTCKGKLSHPQQTLIPQCALQLTALRRSACEPAVDAGSSYQHWLIGAPCWF